MTSTLYLTRTPHGFVTIHHRHPSTLTKREAAIHVFEPATLEKMVFPALVVGETMACAPCAESRTDVYCVTLEHVEDNHVRLYANGVYIHTFCSKILAFVGRPAIGKRVHYLIEVE